MIKTTFTTITIIVCLLIGARQSAFGQEDLTYIDKELILTFNAEHLPSNSREAFDTNQLKQIETTLDVYEYKLTGQRSKRDTYLVKYNNDAYSVSQAIDLYKNTNYFSVAEPNGIMTIAGAATTVPVDPAFSLQWGLRNTGFFPLAPATAGADIDMVLAWDIQQGNSDMIVAIIDSGVKMDHPELANRFWINPNETDNNVDSDNNGYVDDVVGGWNFVSDNSNLSDSDGHGTGITGIIGLNSDNGSGFAGINWNCKFMICKTSNSATSSTSNVVEAIYYAVDNGAKIINMSLGGGSSVSLSNAVTYANNNDVIIVAAMMNNNNGIVRYPAGYPSTIAVGATNPDDTRAAPFFWSPTSGSNYGNHIDVVAPGNYIFGLNHNSNTNLSTYFGGTSQATPVVSGIISLLLSENPNLTFEEIRTILRETAEDEVGDPTEDTPGFDQYYGYGRVNAFSALTHNLLNTNEFEAQNQMGIYPNPLKSYNNKLTIENLNSGEYKIIIYNNLGQQQCKLEISNSGISNKDITLPELASGNYIIEIKSTSGNTQTKKLIVY